MELKFEKNNCLILYEKNAQGIHLQSIVSEIKQKGYGTKTLKEFLEKFKHHDIYLYPTSELGTDVDVLKKWYEKHGFIKIKMFYLNGSKVCMVHNKTEPKKINYKNSYKIDNKELKEILEYIKPYVIVTGSYATGKQTEISDIDFYIKSKPEEEVDLDARIVEDTYCKELMRYFAMKAYTIDSCFVDSFNVIDTIIPLEFSAYYKIDEENIFELNVHGVTMIASISIHEEVKEKK